MTRKAVEHPLGHLVIEGEEMPDEVLLQKWATFACPPSVTERLRWLKRPVAERMDKPATEAINEQAIFFMALYEGLESLEARFIRDHDETLHGREDPTHRRRSADSSTLSRHVRRHRYGSL